MNKTLKKGFMVGVLSLSLVMGLASISLAIEGMGDHSAAASSANMPDMENIASASAVPSAPHEATPGMDTNMPGMDMGASASATPSTPHEATPGMDPNMAGMESSQSTDGHGENGESEGVNWTVVGSFLAVNLLVIGTAGVLKFTKKTKLEILE